MRNWVGALLMSLCVLFVTADSATSASGDIVNCTTPYNISRSEGFASVDPFLLADRTGMVHLFWAEKMTGTAGESPNVPDSLMYARWDGNQWTRPLDIHISPPQNFNKRIGGIRGVMDDNDMIHLVWMGPDDTIFYSSSHADLAASAQAWTTPYLLSNDQTGTQYSVDIAFESPNTLHIAYGRSQKQVNRTVAYIRSEDGGRTWSEPIDIHTFLQFDRGASNLRLHLDPPHRIYATWTEWDTSGRGQAIYFARSLENGLHWQPPVRLAIREGDEYERNWVNLEVLGDDHLIVFWEGGFRAYPQAQYSYDGGITWTEEIDTLYWLIADNGYAEFIRDSSNRLHLFVARRIREGHTYRCESIPGCEGDGNAIWHSIWEGGEVWREPKAVEHTFSPVNFLSVATTQGNRITLAWFDYSNFEIEVMQCQIDGAPVVASQLRPTPTPQATRTPAPGIALATPTATPPLLLADEGLNRGDLPQATTQRMVMFSALPAFAVVMLVMVAARRNRRRD